MLNFYKSHKIRNFRKVKIKVERSSEPKNQSRKLRFFCYEEEIDVITNLFVCS